MARRTCKKCGGDVVYKKYGKFTFTLMFFLAGGCMMWIPILGWIGAAICFILALVMLFCPTMYIAQCKDCGAVENIDEEQYEEVTK